MMLPADIQASELLEGSHRITLYRLPQRGAPSLVDTIGCLFFAAAVPLIYGCYAWFSYFGAEVPPPAYMPYLLSGMGLVVAVIAVAAIGQLLIQQWGHFEVRCYPHGFSVTDRCGLLSWTRAISFHGLKNFRVHARNDRPAIGSLHADYESGTTKPICGEYPTDWLTNFGRILLDHQVRAQGDAMVALYEAQPSTSTAVVEEIGLPLGPKKLQIHLPPVNMWLCVPPLIIFKCLFLLGVLGFLGYHSRGIIEKTMKYAENPTLNLTAGACGMLVVGGIAGWLLLIWISRATRRATITADENELRISVRNLFSQQERRWPRAELLAVRANSAIDANGQATYSVLEIHSPGGRRHRTLDWRPKVELEWLAITLNKRFKL